MDSSFGQVNREWRVILSYTQGMKTAISIPDDTFDRVTRTARQLGMSRSELMTKAAVAYLDDLDSRDLTREIDRVLGFVVIDVHADQAVVDASKARLAEINDEW
jgi:metal-responsive CopG/Arc/MetJ family transcriptional regulator